MFADLLPPTFKEEVVRWIKEDCPKTDIGGFVVGDKNESATLYCKSSTVLAGVPFANTVLEYHDLKFTWNVQEGQVLDVSGEGEGKIKVAHVTGNVRNILLAERTCLNILSRASGVAAAAKSAVDIKASKDWHGYVAGTRKTTPGFGNVEKYALLVGGAATHRLDLSQMVMLKDNHIWSAGSITKAVQKARTAAGFSCKIEVECQNVDEALEAAAAGADIVMLDNFVLADAVAGSQSVKAQFPHVLVEVSGGITQQSMGDYMLPSIDIISRGSLTQETFTQMAGVPRYNFSRQQQDVQESPLFERQMGSEEYIELQQMRSLVDNMQHRISNLEKMNVDLEQRLEDQAKQSMAVEKECLLSEQRWKVKNSELLNEIETWKSSFKQEKVKGDRLREQVHRSERELYGILQRKYEMMRGPGTNKPGLAMGKGPSNADIALGRRGEINHSSSMRDDEYVQASKTSRNKKESVIDKERAVLKNLSDFLGF